MLVIAVAVVVSQRTKRRQSVSGFVAVLSALARNDDAPASLVVTTRNFAAVKATMAVIVDWFPFASSAGGGR
jgi:hypothetical protein